MVENLETLQKIGLTRAEAKTYLALLYLKKAKTGQICEKTGIPSSNIYSILESLMKKGFVSYRIQNNIKIFLPSDPEILDNIFDEKQKTIEQERKEIKTLISELKTQQNISLPISDYKYYEGLQGLKSVWFEMIEKIKELEKNSTIKIYSSPPNTYESLLPIYNEFHKERVKHKIKYKLILSDQDKKHGARREKLYGTEVKFVEMKNESEICIIGNYLLLQYATTKTPRAFLIQDEVFVKTFEQMFDQLWNRFK